MRYGRVLLKVSGESLGAGGTGVHGPALQERAAELAEVRAHGVRLAVVVGGGNIVRGAASAPPIGRVTADVMGMLATVINALALADHLRAMGAPVFVRSAFGIEGMVERFRAEEARRLVDEGHIGIFAGGTGNPFFSTDTAAVLRALEVGAEVLLKGTKVDGVYTTDPKRDPSARRYARISYDDALAQGLLFMDPAATALCREHRLTVIVFDQTRLGALRAVVRGEEVGTMVGPLETVFSDDEESSP